MIFQDEIENVCSTCRYKHKFKYCHIWGDISLSVLSVLKTLLLNKYMIIRMISDIIKMVREVYGAINDKDLHLRDHYYTDDACLVPPGKPTECFGMKKPDCQVVQIFKRPCRHCMKIQTMNK